MATIFPSGLGHLAWWHISGTWTALRPRAGQGGAEAVGWGWGAVPAHKPRCKPSAWFPVRIPHLQTHTGPPTAQPSPVHCSDVDPVSWKTFEKTPALWVSCWGGASPEAAPFLEARLSSLWPLSLHSGVDRAWDLSGAWTVSWKK